MFDLNAAAAAKTEGTTETVLMGDEKFEIPTGGSLPLAFVESLSDNDIAGALRALFADDYDRFMAQRPTVDQTEALFEQLAKQGGFDSAGESPASGGSSRGTTES